MADPYRFDPLQFAVDKATQEPPAPPTYGGFGDVVNALWRSLPQNVRQRYATVPNALAELSPGASARDMVQSSGELTQNVLAGNPLGSINAMAGIGLGAMGMMPGARAPAAVAKELSGADRVAKALADQPHGIRAYHGSPHQFDKFDISKIGTGEGVQVYGHGLYFAENEAVARRYRDSFSDGSGKKAHMYEVRLNVDPTKMLDWEKPLSKQPAPVRAAIKPLITPERLSVEGYTDPRAISHYWRDPSGKMIYQNAPLAGKETSRTSQAELSNVLLERGIPGIQYLDSGSRQTGGGTRNFVIFDPSRIEILRRYGWIPVGVAAGGGTLMAAPDAAQAKP